MPVGKSGKVLIELDPKLKREIYTALTQDGLTMKDWFLLNAQRYLSSRHQRELWSFRSEGTESRELS